MSREDVKRAVQEEIARKRARIEDGILTEEARRITSIIKNGLEKHAIYNFNRGSKKFNIVKYLDNFLTKQKIVELVEIKFSGQAPGRKLTEKESQRVKIVSQKVLTNFAETKTEFFQDIYNIASSAPTIAPSIAPSIAPTTVPTPSIAPTTVPTTEPTVKPHTTVGSISITSPTKDNILLSGSIIIKKSNTSLDFTISSDPPNCPKVIDNITLAGDNLAGDNITLAGNNTVSDS